MPKTTQIAKIANIYTIVYHTDDMNPYWIYRHSRDFNEHGFLTKHKKLVEKYADLKSCLYYIAGRVY